MRLTCMSIIMAVGLLILGAPGLRIACAADPGPKPSWGSPNRSGIVVLQFDDGTVGHYLHAFRILEKYGLKGSFGVVTGLLGRSGRLSAEQVVEMHRAGHEIHDHTLDHNAAFWGNPQKRVQWKEQIEQSLGILKKLGIETRGWNQPGGKGQAWTPELRDTLAPHYDYVAGRVGLKPEEMHNMHWHLKDDPLCLGYGGVGSWATRKTREETAKQVQRIETQIADGIQQGLVTISLWHVVSDADGSASGLEELSRFIRDRKLPVMRMADAVRAVQHPGEFFDRYVEQMPNPDFASDIDANGRPDGYTGCGYASAEIKSSGGGRVAQFTHGATTWVHGPEAGRTELVVTAMSSDGTARTITPVLTWTEIHGKYEHRKPSTERCGAIAAGSQWGRTVLPVTVGPDVDRVKVEFEITPPGKVYVSNLSWRLAK